MFQNPTAFTRLRNSAAIISLLASSFYCTPAIANPTGGTVTAGSITITESGKTLDVTQTTGKGIVDWQSFNINQDETTAFHQPSSSSITLNRINDVNPSQILGHLTANGKIILINPNGVFFGPNSQVDVAGLVATTANINNNDFMNGNMKFSTPGNPEAKIVNEGNITAKEAGLVGFVAPDVENSGTINAKLGKVTLASGDSFTLDMAGDNLITVAVSGDLKNQVASNEGAINANGGVVTLTAAAAHGIVNSVVSNSGTISATSFKQHDGKIILYAEKTGNSTATNSGTLDASGYKTGHKGGEVDVLADNVNLTSTSVVDVSGDAGAGNVKIGGDFHGQGATPTATNTTVEQGAIIKADAITSGNGGQVAVWSDGDTYFGGSISARGGANSGDGGNVETSGKQNLAFRGAVDTQAPNGQDGMLLLDPTNIIISNGVARSLRQVQIAIGGQTVDGDVISCGKRNIRCRCNAL